MGAEDALETARRKVVDRIVSHDPGRAHLQAPLTAFRPSGGRGRGDAGRARKLQQDRPDPTRAVDHERPLGLGARASGARRNRSKCPSHAVSGNAAASASSRLSGALATMRASTS